MTLRGLLLASTLLAWLSLASLGADRTRHACASTLGADAQARALVTRGADLLAAGQASQARELFGLAARAGLPDAQNAYGRMILDGLGGPSDPTEAQKWLLKAAQAGNGPAQACIANLYLEGRGLPQDAAWAFYWASLALTGDELAPGEREQAGKVAALARQKTPPALRERIEASVAKGPGQ